MLFPKIFAFFQNSRKARALHRREAMIKSPGDVKTLHFQKEISI